MINFVKPLFSLQLQVAILPGLNIEIKLDKICVNNIFLTNIEITFFHNFE